VAPFAGDGVRPFEHTSVHHDAAADAGAEYDAEYDRRAAPGAVERFGEREAVCVVRNADLTPERALEVRFQRAPVETGRIRITDIECGGRERAGRAEADAAALADFDLGLAHELYEQRERRAVIAGGRGLAAPQELGAALVERDDLGFGAAEIDAETYQRCTERVDG
jgi:hypothetical protein